MNTLIAIRLVLDNLVESIKSKQLNILQLNISCSDELEFCSFEQILGSRKLIKIQNYTNELIIDKVASR